MQSLPLASYIARPDGSIVFVSQAWPELIGHARDVLGDAYAQLIHPDDFERAIAHARRRRDVSR